MSQDLLAWLRENTTLNKAKTRLRYGASMYAPDEGARFLKNHILEVAGTLDIGQDFEIRFRQAAGKLIQELVEAEALAAPPPQDDVQEDGLYAKWLALKDRTRAVATTAEHKTHIYIMDTETLEESPLAYRDLKIILPDKELMAFLRNAVQCAFEFRPFEAPQDFVETRMLNPYVMPLWRREGHTGEARDISDLLTLLDFLCADTDSFNLICRWAYRSLTSRCREYLMLLGKEGVGKGLFAEKLLFALHGRKNSIKAKSDFLSQRFNDYLECKTYVYLDELVARSPQDLEKLKHSIEDEIGVEGKFRDVTDSKNFASVCISANYPDSVYMDPATARKFTYAELNDKKIVDEFGEDWIEALVENFKDDHYLSAFWKYLVENHSQEEYPILHGPTFERACLYSADELLKWLAQLVLNQELDSQDINSLIQKFIRIESQKKSIRIRRDRLPSVEEIHKFFKAITHNGKRFAHLDIETLRFNGLGEYAIDGQEETLLP